SAKIDAVVRMECERMCVGLEQCQALVRSVSSCRSPRHGGCGRRRSSSTSPDATPSSWMSGSVRPPPRARRGAASPVERGHRGGPPSHPRPPPPLRRRPRPTRDSRRC
ncbi:Os03g0744501, partial [Oryza sativa Japonica Group]